MRQLFKLKLKVPLPPKQIISIISCMQKNSDTTAHTNDQPETKHT